MLFNSYEFIFIYLPAVLFIAYVIGRFSTRYVFVWGVIASLIFYARWSVPYLPLLLGSITFNFILGDRISRSVSAGRPALARLLMVFAVATNLAVLGYYKYAVFFGEVFDQATGLNLEISHVVLPLGISFFTFTQIAYLVDAQRGLTKEYDPVLYALFVTFFPHLIAGPILHHREMMQQFFSSAAFRFRAIDLKLGSALFLVGLAKKVLFADTAAPIANAVFGFANNGVPTIAEAWAGSLAYSMQIYLDFSGYSDMALGLACMMGVRLPLNFNSPYQSKSIIEFWRRWHMTLSRFLKDYLYIPLGGNRLGEPRRLINLMVTMVLGGLWHGAAWTFVVWGALHGVYLIINHLWRVLAAATRIEMREGLSWSLTVLAVVVAWVFFRADSLSAARNMLVAMFGGNGLPLPLSVSTWLSAAGAREFVAGLFGHGLFRPRAIALVLLPLWAIALFLPNSQEMFARFQPALDNVKATWPQFSWQPTGRWAIFLGVVFAMCIMRMGGESPFLYFRF